MPLPLATQIEDDFSTPYQAWRTKPSPESSDQLLRSLDPVITSAVKTFGQGASGPLIRSRARRIVLDALPGYDSSQGKLKPYLNSHLQGLRRLAAQQANVVHVPERIMLDRIALHEATGRLTDELGRDPTDIELMDETGLHPKRLSRIRQYRMPMAEGAMMSPSDGGDPEPFDPEILPSAGLSPAVIQFVYQSQGNPVDQLILEHSLGLNGKKKLSGQTLASRLRLTPAAVSLRKAKLQQQFDDVVRTGVLG